VNAPVQRFRHPLDGRCAACGELLAARGRGDLPPLCPHHETEDDALWVPSPSLVWWPGREDTDGLAVWSEALGLEPDELPDEPVTSGPRRLTIVDGSPVTVFQDGPGGPGGGSYKARGAEVLAALAARRGWTECYLDSSGNAGLAVARAMARRGIACRVLVPETTPAEKLARLEEAGAQLDVVPGDRQAAFDAARALRGRLPYASHIYQPAFVAGIATLAWDLDRLLGNLPDLPWPDRIVLPAGNGALLLGVHSGLVRLAEADAERPVPRLVAVQLAGYASLAADGLGKRAEGAPKAAGIAIASPPRRQQMAAAVAQTGGEVVVVTETEIAAARRELVASHGIETDPTGATAWAAVTKRPDLAGERTVAVLTSRV
jgi:threonine synthase